MRTGVRFLAYAAFIIAGVVMFGFEMVWFDRWWGLAGVTVGVILAPLAAAFPFIYLAREGFSVLYFGVWAAGLVAVVLATAVDDDV